MINPSEIRNIRHGEIRENPHRGTVEFDYRGNTVIITEPKDVLLVGYGDAAAAWIVRNYGFLLAFA